MKKLFGALVAMGVTVLMAVGVQAATYSAGVTSPEAGKAVVPIMVSTVEGESTSVNGYIMQLTYDSTKVEPIVVGQDPTGEESFAEVGDAFKSGVIVSGILDSGSADKTLVVAWAGPDSITVDTEAELAYVTFQVDESATGSVPIYVEVAALTEDGVTEAEVEELEVANGEITIDAEDILLYGDINKDTAIDSYDASLALQHYSVPLLTAEEIEIGDVNDDGVVDSYDASLILQRYSDGSLVFPVEQNK